jgi:type I restriction enzyme, S subunit
MNQNDSVLADLPLGWKWVKLGEVSDKITDGTHFKPQYEADGVAFISVKDVNNEKVSFENCKYISDQAHKDLIKRCHPQEGDILITKSGTIGRLAIVPKSPEFSLFVSVALIKHKREFLNSKYLIYCLENHVSHLDINQQIKGGLLKNYHLEDLRLAQIQLPPLSIQAKIVEKIETLLSELDSGKAQLLTAQAQLKTYRQAVLKYAFEGKLTNENVKEGELPKGWKWVKIDFMLSDKKKGMATGPFGTMLKKHEHQKSGVAVLGIENIGEGVFQMPNKIFITNEKAIELKNFRVIENDVIISRSGTVGEICLLPKKMENSIISTNLIRVRLNLSVINPKFFVFLFEGGKVRQQVFDLCKGSSRAFLNQSILNTLDFPYCSLNEQYLIIQEIESRLSVCDKLEETIKASLLQSESLRQSVLKRAFEGRLL